MALVFRCKNCGEDIAVRFLKVGEASRRIKMQKLQGN